MKAVGWFQIVIGAAIVALWAVLLLTGQVPRPVQAVGADAREATVRPPAAVRGGRT